MYLLDTDILSNLVRPAPSTALIARIAAVPRGERFMSSITLGELLYGAYRLGERGRALLQRLETISAHTRLVLPFDAGAARRYGELRADLERRGTPIGDADMRIAAIALAHELTMVSGNERHFRRVPGLAVENWLA